MTTMETDKKDAGEKAEVAKKAKVRTRQQPTCRRRTDGALPSHGLMYARASRTVTSSPLRVPLRRSIGRLASGCVLTARSPGCGAAGSSRRVTGCKLISDQPTAVQVRAAVKAP